MAAPSLTLILPAYRSASFIEANVRTVLETLEQRDRLFEAIVVCDGAEDDAAEIARDIQDPRVKVIEYPENQGKGFAICVGIAHASGQLIGWLDADLDINPASIIRAERELESSDVDAVLGSKRHRHSKVQYPVARRVLSVGFQAFARSVLRVNARDTQTGAKVFRREMLDVVTPLLLVKRYAFDLEVLTVGALFGFDRIREMPIELDYKFTGTGINSAAVRHMFVDTLAIAYRARVRHWYVRQYAALQRERGAGTDQPVVPASNLALLRRTLPGDPVIARATKHGIEI